MGASLLAAHGSRLRLEVLGEGSGSGDRVLYLPTGRLLRVLDLGYSAVLADLIYLWSIQFYGTYPGGVRWDYLMQIYDRVITELDPQFRDAYDLGALILSVEAKRPEDALRLLEKGIRAIPDDWLLPFEAGFIAYDDLADYRRAAEYFRVSMERPGAHPVVQRFHAEMFRRLGDKRTSLRHWQEILATADSEYLRQVAARHVHDLTLEAHLERLREAIRLYRSREGRVPPGLRDLVRAGLLAEIPVDPEGRPYLYDPTTGEVSSRSVRALPTPTREATR